MKKFLLVLIAMWIIAPEAHALKTYSFDSEGNKVYQTVQSSSQLKSSNKVLTYSKGSNGKTYVYDANGNRLRTYYKAASGKTYVYDSNGRKIRTYYTAPSGNTYVYGANGQRILTKVRTQNGKTVVYENGSHALTKSSPSGVRTMVTTNSRDYSHQFRGTGGSFSSRPAGGGTQIVATNRALYRYGN